MGERTFKGKLRRNLSTPESRAWWAAVEKAGRNLPRLSVGQPLPDQPSAPTCCDGNPTPGYVFHPDTRELTPCPGCNPEHPSNQRRATARESVGTLGSAGYESVVVNADQPSAGALEQAEAALAKFMGSLGPRVNSAPSDAPAVLAAVRWVARKHKTISHVLPNHPSGCTEAELAAQCPGCAWEIEDERHRATLRDAGIVE